MTRWPLAPGALSHYEWIGMLIARLSVGALFALSGWGKLFVRSRREEMVRTLRAAAVPAPEVNAVFVASVEFLFGSLLAIGFLTPLSCVMLSGVMLVALATTVLPAVKASSFAGWLGEVHFEWRKHAAMSRSDQAVNAEPFNATRCVKNLMFRDPTSFHRFTGLQHAAVAKIV